jgi:hypothetical protein
VAAIDEYKSHDSAPGRVTSHLSGKVGDLCHTRTPSANATESATTSSKQSFGARNRTRSTLAPGR